MIPVVALPIKPPINHITAEATVPNPGIAANSPLIWPPTQPDRKAPPHSSITSSRLTAT